MKILYFNYLYDDHQDSVGASVHVNEFVQAMLARGCTIKSFNLNPMPYPRNGKMPGRRRLRQMFKKRLRRYLAQPNQLIRNLPLFFREWKILSKEKPDALLIRYNLLNFSALVAAGIKGIPVVLEVNSPHAFERKKLVKDTWQIPVLPFLTEWLCLKMADRIVVVSGALKSYYLERKIPADKISVIPNGVDADRFSPETSAAHVREKHGLNGHIILGFVGSFHYWHGIENILSLIESSLAESPKLTFLLVGDGPCRQQVETFVSDNDLGNEVILTGYVPHKEVPNYVAAMDIVLAPYPFMDFFYFSPLKIFEYLSAGKAVVASQIGQITEIIEDGENGLLYDPNDLNSFVDKTRMLARDKAMRTRLGKSARDTILQGYSWERNAEEVMLVLESTIGKTGSSSQSRCANSHGVEATSSRNLQV